MSGLKRIDAPIQHPGQLADLVRGLDGRQESLTPYVEGQRYLPMHDGTPAESIPDEPITGADYGVEPLNSPRGLARMHARDMGRAPDEPAVDQIAPLPTAVESDEIHPSIEANGNYVHLDDAFAYLDGEMIPLSDLDLGRIHGIVARAHVRQLSEQLKRVKSAYTVQPQRRKKTMSKSKRARRKAVPQTSPGSPGEPTESAT